MTALALLLAPGPLAVSVDKSSETSVELTAAQLFGYADAARDRGDFSLAEQAYRALATGPDAQLRSEARFRLALMLADRQRKYREAAVELRRILDEQPGAARVRLELARVQALAGNLSAARKEIRAARAAGLPPEVERTVSFYAAALRARKPFGGSFEMALAPDSNVNRATRSDTLGTVIGNFTLSDDARARSGLGLSLRAQSYVRMPMGKANLLARVDTSALFYRASQFNDLIVGIQAGPEVPSGADRITLTAGPTWRWYGTDPYSASLGGEASILHPLGKRGQGRLSYGLTRTANRRNPLQTATIHSFGVSLDRAFSARFGGGLALSALRSVARDPGWSDATGAVTAYAFREIGRTTAIVSAGYSRLEADARLALFPRRRVDDRFQATAAVTWRTLQWKGLAPVTRLKWERNRSTLGLYSYARLAAELGVASAF